MIELPYARFKELAQLSAELEFEEMKTAYRQHALTAWKVTEQIKAIVGNDQTEFKTLPQFWDDHGFGDGSTIVEPGEFEKDVESAAEAEALLQNLFGITPGADASGS